MVLRRRVRTAAAGAQNLDDFLARLRADRVLVRPRLSDRNPGQVTDVPVALTETPIEGDRLLRLELAASDTGRAAASTRAVHAAAASEEQTATSPGSRQSTLDDRERTRIWEQAIGAAARATRQVTAAALTDPNAAGDAAWAAAHFLNAAARVVEGRRRGPLAAADDYDRAAREIFGRQPPRGTPATSCAARPGSCSPPAVPLAGTPVSYSNSSPE